MLDSNFSQAPSLNKSVLQISSLFEPSDEKQYWFNQSPTARLQALELTRQIVYGYDPFSSRLQRVFEIAEILPS